VSRIAKIKSTITSEQVAALCYQWLPRGKQKGDWYLCLSPFRNERTASFGVSLRGPNYWWTDFGGTESGDLIDLCCRLHGVSKKEAIEAFEQMLWG
jgi:DNA primase